MTKVEINIHINRPPDQVFAYISNPENNPQWQGGMRKATITSTGPLGVGSTYVQVASFLGRRIESHFEIVEYEPGHLIKGKTISGTFPITFTRSVEPANPGSHVSALITGQPSGI
ncbi:MAG: SRPBCC family protein, partial [Anaerolineaceae bacterium]